MKIKTAKLDYDEVLKLQKFSHDKPGKPNRALAALIRLVGKGDLKATNFSYKEIGMDKIRDGEPCLILMNHSSIIDLMMTAVMLKNRPYNIVCTYDGFVGKNKLMKAIGCIPTRKFTNDVTLVKDLVYALHTNKCSVLMYPEASYSFDGTETPLPESLGKCLKLLKVPVIMIKTEGAFLRDPLYNNLQLRKVDVSATMTCILTADDVATKSVKELNDILKKQFRYDHFRDQQEKGIKVTEDFRADCLNRVLYKCPHCLTEGNMEGKGINVSCNSCGKKYELTETGFMKATDGDTEFDHIPDWYRWERECVRTELEQGNYLLDIPVDIRMMVNTDCVYEVGEGRLYHTVDGFELKGCEGRLHYFQKPTASYSLYADYFWYEIGDVICIGDANAQYYCFPKEYGDVVAKTRLATEELYKMVTSGR